MILLECIEKYDIHKHCSPAIEIGDIVAVMSVDTGITPVVNVQIRKSTEWPNGLRQGEGLNRFRFIPASQHYRALKYGDIPTTGDFK